MFSQKPKRGKSILYAYIREWVCVYACAGESVENAQLPRRGECTSDTGEKCPSASATATTITCLYEYISIHITCIYICIYLEGCVWECMCAISPWLAAWCRKSHWVCRLIVAHTERRALFSFSSIYFMLLLLLLRLLIHAAMENSLYFTYRI